MFLTIGGRNGQRLTEGGKTNTFQNRVKVSPFKKKFNVYEDSSRTGCLLGFTQKCLCFLRLHLSLSSPGGWGNLG